MVHLDYTVNQKRPTLILLRQCVFSVGFSTDKKINVGNNRTMVYLDSLVFPSAVQESLGLP